MGTKLKDYIRTKLTAEQRLALCQAAKLGWRIRIIGAYSGHEAIWLKKFSEVYPPDTYPGFRHLVRPITSASKRFNRRRPYFLVTQKKSSQELILNIVAFPSREYVQQVAGLISAAFRYKLLSHEETQTPHPAALEVVAFPMLERAVGEWTGLRAALRQIPAPELARGVLFLGYVEEIVSALGEKSSDFTRRADLTCNSQAVDRVFEINAYEYKSQSFSIFTFGFDHTYWGRASAHLVREFLNAGIKHIVYFAKLGSRVIVNSEHDDPLDTRIATGGLVAAQGPYYHLLFESGKYRRSEAIVPQKLLTQDLIRLHGPHVKITHQHLSVPSVVGETRKQESSYHVLNPTTIDNEIAYMAEVVSNERAGATLDCLHYVTDFVTAAYSQGMDLHAGLDKDDRAGKGAQLKVAATFLVTAIEASKRGQPNVPSRSRSPPPSQPGVGFGSTRDYLSLFDALPADFPAWLRPPSGYDSLRGAPDERAAILASATLEDGKAPQTGLLEAVLGSNRAEINLSGPPGGGKSLVARCIYFELLQRFKDRTIPARPFLLELKTLEAQVIESGLTSAEEQRKLIEGALANAESILRIEATVGPLIIIVNGINRSSLLFAQLKQRLNLWRAEALREGRRIVAVWRKSEWIADYGSEDQGREGYWADIDVARLGTAANAALLGALCHVYEFTREQFFAAVERAIRATGERSPTLRVVIHFIQGKAHNGYFPEMSAFYLGVDRQDDSTLLAAAHIAYRLVVDPKGVADSPLTYEQRLVSGSEEMTAYYAASYIHNRIHELARPGLALAPAALNEMDRVFSHRINHQLKRVVCASNNSEQATLRDIQKLWAKLSMPMRAQTYLHFKSVLMYLCGRFTDADARKKGRTLLHDALRTLSPEDRSGGALSLHRTVHISLMFLDEHSSAYFGYLRSDPLYDELNRGFHLTYYHDQDYSLDPQMESPDRGGRFSKTLSRLKDMLLSPDSPPAVLPIHAYTVISLFANRFARTRLTETIPLDEALALLLALEQQPLLPYEVRTYARWAHHYLNTGTSVVLQAIVGLKRESRAGWNYHKKNRTVPNAESVADHTMGAVLLARTFLPEDSRDLDAEEQAAKDYSKVAVIDMLAVHDLAEGLLGDVVAPERLSHDDTEELGLLMGIAALAAAGGGPRAFGSAQMESALAEFQAGRTLNARLAADFDRLDNLLQLAVYRVDPSTQVPDSREFDHAVRARLTTRTVSRIGTEICREMLDKTLSQLTNSDQSARARRRPPI